MKSKTPQKHADVIKAWADGHQIQWRHTEKDRWIDIEDKEIPSWIDLNEYRVKPEREYPKTSLTAEELYEIEIMTDPQKSARLAIANAAIKRYIDENEGMAKEAYINGIEAAISIINKSTMIIPYDMFKEYDNFRISIVGRIEKEISAARV